MYTHRGFMKAVMRGDTETVAKYFANRGASTWLALKDGDGNTPLHLAAQHGHIDVIRQLLQAGAGIEAANGNSLTPLGIATVHGRAPAMKMLIENGANVKTEICGYGSLICAAVWHGRKDAVQVLIDAKADPNEGQPMIQAIDRRDYGSCEVLLKAGADPNQAASNGFTPLHYAAYHGADGLMKTLIEKDAKIDAQDNDGRTPLHIAIQQGHAKQVQALIEKGARIDIEDNRGMTPHQCALDRGNNLIIRIIDPIAKDAVAKSTTALSANASALPPEDAEVWVAMGSHQVARVGVYPALSRRLTEIFNFESRERMIISENLKTGAESVTQPESFDNVAESLLQKAQESFRRLGGSMEEQAPGAHTLKKTLKP